MTYVAYRESHEAILALKELSNWPMALYAREGCIASLRRLADALEAGAELAGVFSPDEMESQETDRIEVSYDAPRYPQPISENILEAIRESNRPRPKPKPAYLKKLVRAYDLFGASDNG